MAGIFYRQDPNSEFGSWRVVDDNDGHYNDMDEVLIEIQDESDRGIAIVAAAMLDRQLEDILIANFQNTGLEKECTSNNGPLSSFSSKIQIAFSLGLISESENRNLQLIRKIRNDFAHLRSVSFDQQTIANRCRSLDFAKKTRKSDPAKYIFIHNAVGIMFTFFDRPSEIIEQKPKVLIKTNVQDVREF